MRVGDRVWFVEDVRPFTVQAISDSGRYVVCTKPFAARRTVLYTVLDLVGGVRGVDDSLGNSLGYETRADCERAAALFDAGTFGLSRRRPPIPIVIRDARPADIMHLLALIRRIVTGDGAQLENLDLTDEEWRALGEDMHGADYVEHFEVTMRFDDWLALVHLARPEVRP